MNYNEIKKYQRSMNFFEKLITGWRHVIDNRWEWWYHLTESEPRFYGEFWHCLNMDMVKFEEEIYYQKNKKL
jgi:hypothetical protein